MDIFAKYGLEQIVSNLVHVLFAVGLVAYSGSPAAGNEVDRAVSVN